MLDVKKIFSSPKNGFDAIDAMVKSQQLLMCSIHILQAVIDNPDDMDYHDSTIRKFLSQFQIEEPFENIKMEMA